MKLWNQRTHKGRKFYRLNHGGLSKDLFYLSYYRILHTAYLKKEAYCIPTIKSMFLAAFGVELSAWSQYYMMDTENCFANDDVINNLNHRAVFQNMDMLQTLLIEIGFDVYLVLCFNKGEKPARKSFYQWLPIKKSHKLKKMVKLFWKERLPKEKSLQQLGLQLQAFAPEIASVYRKLLIENDVLLTMTPQRAIVLDSISSMLESRNDVAESTEQLVSTVELEYAQTEPDKTTITECTESTNSMNSTDSIDSIVKPVIPPVATIKTVRKPGATELPKGRGFREKKTMSAKKAVTCAVCVAAAGALLLPLVAYSVMKQK